MTDRRALFTGGAAAAAAAAALLTPCHHARYSTNAMRLTALSQRWRPLSRVSWECG
jgi:type VI protein secretion system component VasK